MFPPQSHIQALSSLTPVFLCGPPEVLKDIITQKDVYLKQDDGSQKKRALISIQRGLIKSQELGDEKLQLVSQILEHIENRTRQLEQDLENLGLCEYGLQPAYLSNMQFLGPCNISSWAG